MRANLSRSLVRTDGGSTGTTERNWRSIALVGATAGWAAWTLAGSASGTIGAAIGFWLAVCFAGEWLWVRLPLGGATVSMASSANFAALLILPQDQAMAVAAISTWLSDLFLRRKPMIRAVFNVSQTMLAVAAGATVFRLIAGRSDAGATLGDARLLPALAASAAAWWIVNTGFVALAIGCASRSSPFRAWRENFGRGTDLVASGATLSLGAVIAIHHALAGPWATLLVVLPLLIAYDSYRRRFPAKSPGALAAGTEVAKAA